MLYENLGRNIRRRRILRQLTQEKLAEKAGISLSFLGHIERGTRKMSVETLYSISVALQCSADELLELSFPSENAEHSAREILRQVVTLVENNL